MKNPVMYLVASVLLIFLGLTTLAIVRRFTPKSESDIRARAASTQSIKLKATVQSINDAAGVIQVVGVHFASETGGNASNLGAWDVTAPPGFMVSSLTPGQTVTISVDPKSFQVSSHSTTALTIIPAK